MNSITLHGRLCNYTVRAKYARNEYSSYQRTLLSSEAVAVGRRVASRLRTRWRALTALTAQSSHALRRPHSPRYDWSSLLVLPAHHHQRNYCSPTSGVP